MYSDFNMANEEITQEKVGGVYKTPLLYREYYIASYRKILFYGGINYE